MKKSNLNLVSALVLAMAGGWVTFGQSPRASRAEESAKLVAVLQSEAAVKEKVDACRELAVAGTKDAVAVLAGLLADEQLSHNARYALEPMPFPAVDEAFRTALAELKGRPLVGVIGSIGVRGDRRAVPPLRRFLNDRDDEVAQAAARALGSIGTPAAAKALQAALPGVTDANRLALCEGLLRCAEKLVERERRDGAIAIYDQLRSLEKPHQARAGGLRGAILARGKEGLPLLREHLQGEDPILFAAAIRTTQEMPGADVTAALAETLDRSSADNRVVAIQTLALRKDPSAVPALLVAAKTPPTPVRLAAIRALAEIDHSDAVPLLVGTLSDPERQVAEAARESLASLTCGEAEAAVLALFASGVADERVAAIELIARRRMVEAVPKVLRAASAEDAKVRLAALRRLSELAGPKELPALLDLLGRLTTRQELDAAEQALNSVSAQREDADACAASLAAQLNAAGSGQKGVLLRVLSGLGGTSALRAVQGALSDPDAEVRTAAIRALGAWKTADPAPRLLEVARSGGSNIEKTLALRGYLSIAGQGEVPVETRLAMCRNATELAQRTEEK